LGKPGGGSVFVPEEGGEVVEQGDVSGDGFEERGGNVIEVCVVIYVEE